MRINTNISSMRTQEYLRQNQAQMDQAMNRLSSGKRINTASDDAAGLAIATRMRAKESGLGVASRNTQDGISMIQTGEAALSSVSNILVRMRDLAVQSANGTNDTKDQTSLDTEFKELQKQINYIAENTTFNNKTLLKGTESATGLQTSVTLNVKIQTLDSNSDSQQIDVMFSSAKASDLGVTLSADAVMAGTVVTTPTVVGIDIKSAGNARTALEKIDAAINKVAESRATLGATLNRLDFNVENLNSQATNMAASASQIEDADMAKEMSEMTKFKILSEAGISMLSQANQTPQAVSKLLQ